MLGVRDQPTAYFIVVFPSLRLFYLHQKAGVLCQFEKLKQAGVLRFLKMLDEFHLQPELIGDYLGVSAEDAVVVLLLEVHHLLILSLLHLLRLLNIAALEGVRLLFKETAFEMRLVNLRVIDRRHLLGFFHRFACFRLALLQFFDIANVNAFNGHKLVVLPHVQLVIPVHIPHFDLALVQVYERRDV